MSATEILDTIRHRDWFDEVDNRIRFAELTRLCERMDQCEYQIQSLLEQNRILIQQWFQALAIPDPSQRNRQITRLIQQVRSLHCRIQKIFQVLQEEPYSTYVQDENPDPTVWEENRIFHRHLIQRYRERCRPAFEKWQTHLQQTIRNWMASL